MLIPLLSMTLLSGLFGLGLAYAARKFHVEGNPLVEEVAGMMPNSQCGLCGLPGCGAAAERMVKGEAPLTSCIPGGKALAQRIAEKLGVPLTLEGFEEAAPKIASIDERFCTGCAKCYKVCSTDAIFGASKRIHGVIAELCTGCGKCAEICPNEAVELNEVVVSLRTWRWQKPLLQQPGVQA